MNDEPMQHSDDFGELAPFAGLIQLILAEKRTSLAALRTGIGITAIPLSLFSFLIAASRYLDPTASPLLFYGVLAVGFAMLIFGLYIVVRAVRHIHHQDTLIDRLKKKNPHLSDWVD